MLATATAVVAATLLMELVFVALLGLYLLPLAPLAGTVIGVPVGAAQWLVLRRIVPDSTAWIWVTGLGFGAAWLILMTVGFYAVGSPVFGGAAGAAVLGLAQMMVARRWSDRAPMWVPVSTAAWTAFVAIVMFAPRSFPILGPVSDRLVSWAAGYATQSALGAACVGSLVAGGVTAAALVWMLEPE